MSEHDRTRWLALYVLCAGSLMIVLDTTIVNVALPSIRTDLGFSARRSRHRARRRWPEHRVVQGSGREHPLGARTTQL